MFKRHNPVLSYLDALVLDTVVDGLVTKLASGTVYVDILYSDMVSGYLPLYYLTNVYMLQMLRKIIQTKRHTSEMHLYACFTVKLLGTPLSP